MAGKKKTFFIYLYLSLCPFSLGKIVGQYFIAKLRAQTACASIFYLL